MELKTFTGEHATETQLEVLSFELADKNWVLNNMLPTSLDKSAEINSCETR